MQRRVPVIAGCGAPSTALASELAVVAACSGVDALPCAPPPYSRPTQDGIIGHVCLVAHASGLPLLLHDVPARSAVAISDVTVANLFERGLIAGIKDATGDLSRLPRLRRLCGPQLTQLGGDDATALAYRRGRQWLHLGHRQHRASPVRPPAPGLEQRRAGGL